MLLCSSDGSTQPVGIFQSTGGGSGKNAILEQFVYLHDTSLAGLEFIQPALSFQWKGMLYMSLEQHLL